MTRLALALLFATSPALANPYVVPYQPPPVESTAHHGVTLELAAGFGSSSVDESTGGGAFAIGGWITREVALAFRATEVGSYGFAGASVQYYATPALWTGAGIGALSERAMDEFGGTTRRDGTGGFVRAGYNVAGSAHVPYLSAELQVGALDSDTRAVGLVAVGYRLL